MANAFSPYSFRVGQSGLVSNSVAGTQPVTFLNGGVDVTGGFTNVSLSPYSPAVGPNNFVLLNFTPVPEPATVLLVAGLGLGAARLRRRRLG